MVESDKIVITFPSNKNAINESFLRSFGAAVELIIKKMFGLNNLDFKVKGPRCAVEAFTQALDQEREYMDSFQKLGLMNPSVINNKSRLQSAIREFERTTGIKWPLK